MERIRCPHCNAVNQDVEPTDNCWQCGKPLGAAAPARPAAPVATTAETLPTAPMAQVEQQATAPAREGQSAPTLEERVAARKAARKDQNRALPAIVIAVLLIIALIVFLVLRH
jgi:hypothetical protein